MNRIRVFATTASAYSFVWREWRAFATLALLPVLALVLYDIFDLPFLTPSEEAEQATKYEIIEYFGLILIRTLFDTLVWIIFAVAWHRLYLLPATPNSVRTMLRWGWRQTRFLLLVIGLFMILIAIGLCAVVVFAALGLATTMFRQETSDFFDANSAIAYGVVAMLLATPFVIWLYLYGRFALVFPATAIDHHLSFDDSWEATWGNGLRLSALALIAPAPAYVVSVISLLTFASGVEQLIPELETLAVLLGALAHEAVRFVGIAAWVTALSIAYRELMAARRGQPAAGA